MPSWIYTGPIHLLPTAFQQFKNSNYRYWPARSWKNASPNWKTNKAKWAKQ